MPSLPGPFMGHSRGTMEGRKPKRWPESVVGTFRGERKGGPGRVREEGGAGSPGVPAAGLGAELRGRRRRMAGEQSCVGAGIGPSGVGATCPI